VSLLAQSTATSRRIHLCWSDKTSTVILLSCLVKHGVLTLAEAKDTYKDVHVGVKYICNIHYVKAVLYIVGEIERMWHSLPADFSPDVIDDVPVDVIQNIAAHLQDAAYSLDVTVQDALGLQPKNVVAFFKGCMTRYSYDVLRCRFSLLDANYVNDDSDDEDMLGLSHPQQDSSLSTADKLQGPECSGEEGDIVEISAEGTEEDSLTAGRTEITISSPDDPQTSAALVDNERSTERYCLLCEFCRHERNLRATSKYPVQNLILIGALFMGNKINMDTARRIYNDTRSKRVRICKDHFVEAKDVELNEIEITRFYNDCMAKYHSEDPPKLYESDAISSSSAGQSEDPEEVAIDDESGSSRKRKLPSVNSSDVIDKKMKRQKDHFCAATFLYCEVQQNGENLSDRDFASLSALTKYGLCERIQMYCDLVGNGFDIKCMTIYHVSSMIVKQGTNIVQHAEAQSAIQSREQRKQATVASVIDEVVAQTSMDSAIRESVVPVQPVARDYNVMPDKAECSMSYGESEPLQRGGFWSRGEVDFVDSSDRRRRLELYRRAPLISRNRKQFCGLCYQNRCVSNFRKAMSTSNRSLAILLSLLLKQDLIPVKVAKHAYKNRSALFICHEHFIQAGASIMADIEDKFGKLDGDAVPQ
ncbi:hypothetical protein OSTOST_21502, partial [Ostertagia ostertagi]